MNRVVMVSNDCDHVHVSHSARLCNILVNLIDDLMMKDSGSEAKPPCSMIKIALTRDFETTIRA